MLGSSEGGSAAVPWRRIIGAAETPAPTSSSEPAKRTGSRRACRFQTQIITGLRSRLRRIIGHRLAPLRIPGHEAVRPEVQRGHVHDEGAHVAHEPGAGRAAPVHLFPVRRDVGQDVELVEVGQPPRAPAGEIAEIDLPVGRRQRLHVDVVMAVWRRCRMPVHALVVGVAAPVGAVALDREHRHRGGLDLLVLRGRSRRGR